MLSLILALVAGAAAPATPPDGTYTYISTMARGSGTSSITVKHDGASTNFTEHASGKGDTFSGTATASLTLDPQLAPSAYKATYTFGSLPVDVSLAFAGAKATEQTQQGAVDFALGTDASHFVVVDGVLLSGYLALPAQMQAWQNAHVMGLVPMIGKNYALGLDTASNLARPTAVPANDRLLSFVAPIAFAIWYDPASLIVDEIDVPSQNATIVRRR